MDFKNSDIANGMELTSLIGADASASLEGAALLQMAIQSGNIMPLTADGQLVLPAGVGLDDIKVVGRDLIIQMPDGTQMIVPDGAIFVPQIVVEGVAIPALNFAALLTGQEPQPAAGLPQSSGGNFADAVGDIGDPFALGDLLPPTALAFPDPELQEVVPGLIDRDPDVVIQDGGPASRDVVDNVGEAGLPGTRTSGVVETPGSAAGNGSDSTTGTIFLTSPDGIASIIINGVVVTGAAGQQIVSPRGVLTLGAQNGDQIAYTYRLTDNTSGDATTDVFLVSLTDPDGDVATARLTINIADDVPTARNDIDSLAGGTFGPELGNVLTGAGTISGLAGADTLGADGAAISGFRAGASGSFAAVGSNIAGQYGTLTLGANGSYSYVRNGNTPGGVTDVFTYQLTDTDGDAATATLTINIGDAPNRITFIPDIGDGTIVREPHLPTRGSEPSGSQFDGNAEATSGTITFNSPDGVGNVTVAGVVLTPGALRQLVNSNATGSLVVTGYNYNPVTGIGSITYVYTLNDNTLNTNGESLGFPIVVTDLDGDVASGSLTIKIEDDAPLAVNDSATQQAENAPVSVNIFVNDTSGADGVNLANGVAVVAGSLTGAGALAYNNNGSFTYTPALGEEGVVTFQYVITDGDGDTSTATVTISLLEDSVPSVEVRGENVVAEAGLASGSDAASNSETTDGSIAIATGGDALASLVINNVNVTAGGTVTGASGILSVTVSQGVYSYSYTLTDNTSGDATTDSFNVIVTDSDGDSAQDTLVIAIQDDTPSAADDTDNIAAGAYGPVTGNVITDAEGDGGADTQGADGAAVTAVTGSVAGSIGGTTAGTYGVLTLNADGSYSYARNAGTAGGVSDVFTYTLSDGDGDIAIATLTIRIADSPTTLDVPAAGEAGTLVDEAGLASGSDANSTRETTSGSIAFTAPDGPASVTIDGQAVTSVGQSFAGNFGILTVTSIANGAIGYSYTLTTITSGDTIFDDFAVVVTDQDGDMKAGTLVIDIIDDVPTARADIDSVTEDAAVVADGNVLTGTNVADANITDGVADTSGADGASVTAISFGATNGTVGSALAGAYGALTINANGSYSYALNNANAAVQGLDGDDSLTEIFTYTATDGDGDTSTTTLTVTINGSDDPITINGLNADGPDRIVDEDDLVDGSSPDAPALTQTGSFTVNGMDGIASIKIGGAETSVGQTFANAFGTFTITSVSAPVDGSATAITIGYRYVLTDNSAHANANGENFITETFSVAVTDTDGSTDTDQVEVQIIDDVPMAVNDTDVIASGSNLPAVGNVITDAELDGGKDTAGADTVIVTAIIGAAAGTVGGTTAGTYGVLTLNANGSYSYARNDGTPGDVQDLFTYTITDSDGDTSSATLTINILDDRPIVETNATVLLDDDALSGGNAGGTGDDADALNVTGTLSGSGGDGALTFAYQLTGAPDGFSYVAGANGSVLVQQAGTTVLTITLNSATGAYAVTQNAAIVHAAGDNENNAPFTLNYTVSDVDGDAANGTLVVNVDDDTPTARADIDSVTEGGSASGNVLTGLDTSSGVAGADIAGADSFTAGGGVVGVRAAGADTTTAVAGGTGSAIAGLYGSLTLGANGSYTYVSTPDAVASNQPDVFVYTVRDADGDLSTTTLTLNVANVTVTAADTDALVNEAGLAIGSDPSATSEVFNGAITPAGGVGGYTYTLTTPITGTYGNLALNSDGTYTYTLTSPFDTSPDANNSTNTEQGRDSFGYRVTDANGNTVTGTILVDIVDDVPKARADIDSVTEDGPTVADGNVLNGANVADANTTDGVADVKGADGPAAGGAIVAVTGGTIGTPIVGTYGSLTLNANGSYTYTLDNDNAAVQALDVGETLAQSYTYTVRDADGDMATATLTVTINGTNDAPVAVADTHWTIEDASSAITGNVLNTVAHLGGPDAAIRGDIADTDVDIETLTVTTTGVLNGAYGKLTLNADGSYSYSLYTQGENASAYTAVQARDVGDAPLSDVFNYSIIDGTASAGSTLTISVFGANDAPIANNDTNWVLDVTSGANPTASGNVLTTLAHPSDPSPSLSFSDIADSDVDVETLTVTTTGTFTGTFGTLLLNADGTYTYTLNATNAEVNALDTNETLIETFNYTATDGTATASATLRITIFGTNDAPVAVADTNWVLEDGANASGNVLNTVPHLGAPDSAIRGDVADTDVDVEPLSVIAGIFVGTYGTLTLSADGSYTYVLNNANAAVQALDTVDAPLTDSFPYTVSDGTASASSTLTISIFGTNDAPVVGVGTAVVSEEGLTNGRADTLGSPTDVTDSVTATGTISITDSDVETQTVTLGDPGAVLTADGLPVTWTDVGTNTIIGSVGAVEVIRVAITNAGAYTVTLSQSVDHPTINAEDLKSFTVPVNVNDGTVTVSSTLTVIIEDGSPSAVNDGQTTIEGAAAFGGNVLTNDFSGADTPAVVTAIGAAAIGGSAVVLAGTYGSLTINASGAYTYTPNASVPSGSIDSFTYTMRDADGDTSTATLAITYSGDANLPTASNVTASVDDDGLAGNNPASTTGDLADPAPGGDGNEATFVGNLGFNFGIDGPAPSATDFVFTSTSGTVGTETVSYAWDNATSTLTATVNAGLRTGTVLFDVVVNQSTGAYTLTLRDNVIHTSGSNENDALASLNYTVTDSDGSPATGSLAITFDDDAPTLGLIQNGTANNLPGSATTTGALNFIDGADDTGPVGTISLTTTGITSGGKDIVTEQVGNVLTGYADVDLSGTKNVGDTAVFTLTVNPTAGSSGQYVFDLIAPLDGVIVNTPIGGSSSFGAGPTASQILSDAVVGSNLAVVSGWLAGGSFNAVNWYNGTNALPAGLTLNSVNGSTGGWGVANNNFTAGEFLRFDFGAPMDDFDGAGPYVAPAVSLPAVSYATFDLIGYGGTDTIQFRVHYTDGTSANETATGTQSGYLITAPAGKFIDWIDLYTANAGGSGKIDLTAVGVQNTFVDRTLGFNVTLTDRDGDAVIGSFSVNVKDGNTPSSSSAPVVLDLDGDGVEFVSTAAGVTFDYHGDGSPESTAWVGADDGLLALDKNGDGIVNNGSEIIFARDSLTDLQGLAADYDSNRDGVLDANDVDFAKFGVWQDANSNGVTDAGEYRSLSDAGIVSIGLVSDGIAYSAANGSVSVAGQSVYTKADGSTGIVADAAFATNGTTSVASRSADQIRTSNVTTSVIAAALVGIAVEENAAAAPNENLGKLGEVASEASANGNGVVSSASTSEASVVSTLAFQPTQEFGQRTNDVGSSLRPSEEAGVARGLQDAPMAERSALLEDKADPASDDQGNFAGAFGGGDQVMHSMLDITAFSASAGAGDSAALPIPIADTLREAMPDLILDRLIDAFTAALGAPANDAGGDANDSALLVGILNQDVDAFQLAAMASNDLSSAHHYDMAMISHG
jgi:large repetitive protein